MIMDEEKILKIETKLLKIFFPRNARHIPSGEFGICLMEITKTLPDSECAIEEKTIKLKGICPKTEYGTTYKVYCKLAETNEKWGETYEIIYMLKCIDISDKDKQKEFLRSVINENTVNRLFEKYDDVISILDNKDVESLIKVKGIGNHTAMKLISEYEDSKDYSSIYMELGKLGLTHTFIKTVVDFYHSPDTVIEVIRNNPYDLTRIDGIGFKKADEIAIRVGIEQFDPRRVKGFLLYHLSEQGELGKSYLSYQELMQALYDNLGFVPEEVISKAVSMMGNEIIVLDDGMKISHKRFYNLERRICEELIRLKIGRVSIIESDTEYETDGFSDVIDELITEYIPKQFVINHPETIIQEVEDKQGYKFTDEQIGAIMTSIDNNIIALTGGAGMGKTSTANGICSLYKDYEILACALSGKASVRITEATGLPASTIHKALGFGNGKFVYNKDNKLPYDIVVIDEATMINGSLFLSLLEAVPTGAKVIIMGDVQQLTPIGNCQVFADILNSDLIPSIRLTKPHRQALESGIIPLSIKIANQEKIFVNDYTGKEILGDLKDMELNIFAESGNVLSDEIVTAFQREMQKFNDIMEVQIVLPMKTRGDMCCYNLNQKIQTIYNPKFLEGNEIEVFIEKSKDEPKSYIIRKGDKVINTKNNYKSINIEGKITPVFNGNMGIVQEIDDNGNTTIDFVGIGVVIFDKTASKNLELGYAVTVHKSQGSGFASTIVGMDNNSFIMNNSEMLYTAITRAKKYCILVGNNKAISKSIKTKELKTKQTYLKEFLEERN